MRKLIYTLVTLSLTLSCNSYQSLRDKSNGLACNEERDEWVLDSSDILHMPKLSDHYIDTSLFEKLISQDVYLGVLQDSVSSIRTDIPDNAVKFIMYDPLSIFYMDCMDCIGLVEKLSDGSMFKIITKENEYTKGDTIKSGYFIHPEISRVNTWSDVEDKFGYKIKGYKFKRL